MNAKYLCLKIYPFLLLGFFFTLTGCSDNNGTSGPTPTSTITVSGKAVDQIGSGIVSATIVIGDSIKTTAADGSFSISNVTVPYDVKIITGGTGMVYKGLTTASPKLLGLGAAVTPNSATLNVTLPALVANQSATVIFTDQSTVQASDNFTFPATAANITVDWAAGSGTSISGKIIVLVYTLAGGNITTYDKTGEKPQALNNGGVQAVNFTAAELTTNPGELTISGSLTIPAGFTSPNNLLGLKYITNASNQYVSVIDYFSTAAFNYVVPTGLATTPQFVVGGGVTGPVSIQKTSRYVIATAPNPSLTIVLETPPNLTTPPNAATNIDTNTNFTYTTGSGTGIYLASFSTVSKTFYVFTNSTTTKIPNLNAFGLGVGSSLAYNWNVIRINDITTTDAFVAAPLLFNTLFSATATSEQRPFTSAP
ncbi:MAG: hypothetical protein ABI462_09820 [Ignavibacteria bacterium]